ncbi:Uncharacterised protein [Weissella viridescens]|uniref:Uncharacterized protein n=1 Tax=Weissella viridescens TaxID=1629 RepID=A0A380NZM3_WEIVI|nr:Uncharacterised protein [Weissella viridescens]
MALVVGLGFVFYILLIKSQLAVYTAVQTGII